MAKESIAFLLRRACSTNHACQRLWCSRFVLVRGLYDFDGKLGLWSFMLERPAKCSNVRTGTVVGETMLLEDVRVDAEADRQKIVGNSGMFASMRQKMWWFPKNATYTSTDAGTRQPCGTLIAGK